MSYQKDKHRFQLEQKLKTDLKSSQKKQQPKRHKTEEKSSKASKRAKLKEPQKSQNNPAQPVTLPMKSCLKTGTSKSEDPRKKIMMDQHAHTMRINMMSTERFAEIEGIRCINLNKRRCNSALATTLLKIPDNQETMTKNYLGHLGDPTQYRNHKGKKEMFQGKEIYKPLDGSVRSLTLNRAEFTRPQTMRGQGVSVMNTKRPLFQSQVMAESDRKPLIVLDSDRKPLINKKELFGQPH